ncbi:MAG TPA: PIG-L family deacetylase [Thermoanaerobaculia bacterium]|nr:PIG-L family deacetylase [Thermoanaerobaculia bacterium]
MKAPPLPGRTERVSAASALAVAPHYDDEVLGCGGLLAQLAAGGAAVRVLFLTDGGGGAEEVEDRDAYRARRRKEAARAAAVLGLAGSDHLGLPDGALEHHLAAATQGIRRALLTQRPDLLLCPSPLELTADHRAAFAALHHLLGPLREGEGAPAELEAARELRILLYEVNHPAYPDLLVEVSGESGTLRAAMECYASQQERHPYLAAALGLRRFRTLSLESGVDLVEAYRQLALDDFTTRSPAQLLRHLGAAPPVLEVREGPAISVVVRTRDRPRLLAEALASLAEGHYRRATVVLVNDGGAPPPLPDPFPLPIVRVDLPANQGRAAAAEAGIAAATGDYVAFLDDDDLAAPEHLATLAGLVSAAEVRVAYTDAAVAIYELDPQGEGWSCRERRLPYSRDFDADLLLLDNYIPFNTLLIERRLLLEVGPPDRALPFFEDWDLLIRLSALASFHHFARVTCEYRHFRGGSHHVFGERPRERADFLTVKARVLAKHAARLRPEALARSVDTLRAELVAEREARAGASREAAQRSGELAALARAHQELARERFRFEDRYHAVNGALAALRDEHERLRLDVHRLGADSERQIQEIGKREEHARHLTAELERAAAEHAEDAEEQRKLRQVVGDQTAHLGSTYAEIERLNGLIREMESTRAWRAHQWWQRRFS